MRRTITFPFLGLALFLFCWINLPKGLSDRIRSIAVAPFGRPSVENGSAERARLQLENQHLRTQMDHAYEWVLFGQRLGEQFESLKGEPSQKRAGHLRELLLGQLSSLPAQVIYRDPSSWSSSLWVNVGEENNRILGHTLIAKNSPVLAEDGALVGVVDYVGKKQARIRLITDSGLSPAVQICRGAAQNRELAHQLQALLHQLKNRDDLFSTEVEKEAFFAQLHHLQERSGVKWEDGYLAKGEVHGSSAPFWRSRGPLLKGIGFHFDYPDKRGTLPDSRGELPLLKEGDLLVTSGLDGVFPRGLRVGTVTWVEALKEGSYAYEIEVRPSVNHLNDLHTVFILSSLSE